MSMKVKTKVQKRNFKEGVLSILAAHQIIPEKDNEELLIKDLETYFNEVYKPDDSTPYWSDLVNQWREFYKEIVEDYPEFNPIEAINLKRLSKILRTRYMKNVNGDPIWDLNTCLRQHLIFYTMVTSLNFYRKNLSLTIMYSKFNEITSQLAELKKSQTGVDNMILNKNQHG